MFDIARNEHEGIMELLFRRLANIHNYDVSSLPRNDLDIIEGCVFYQSGEADNWKPIRMLERGEEGFLIIMGLWCASQSKNLEYGRVEDVILADIHVYGVDSATRLKLETLGRAWIKKMQ